MLRKQNKTARGENILYLYVAVGFLELNRTANVLKYLIFRHKNVQTWEQKDNTQVDPIDWKSTLGSRFQAMV